VGARGKAGSASGESPGASPPLSKRGSAAPGFQRGASVSNSKRSSLQKKKALGSAAGIAMPGMWDALTDEEIRAERAQMKKIALPSAPATLGDAEADPASGPEDTAADADPDHAEEQ
jgi:hypothetical protein